MSTRNVTTIARHNDNRGHGENGRAKEQIAVEHSHNRTRSRSRPGFSAKRPRRPGRPSRRRGWKTGPGPARRPGRAIARRAGRPRRRPAPRPPNARAGSAAAAGATSPRPPERWKRSLASTASSRFFSPPAGIWTSGIRRQVRLRRTHRLGILGLVVDAQQLRLVEYHLFAALARKVVEAGQLNRVDGQVSHIRRKYTAARRL